MVIAEAASQVEALCLLAPVDDILIAADRADRHPSAEPDYVVAPGPASRALARLMLPAPLKAALDLGCGTGYLACRLAARADRVVATDINPRAVAFSRFNAALNGLSNLKCRQGNLFEPLDGNRFDLIGCNPPYVIAPQSTYLYRDGGPGLCRQILAEAAEIETFIRQNATTIWHPTEP